MNAPGQRGQGERGSALLMALVFVTAFSLFVAAIVSFAEVGLKASNSYASQLRSAYAADGAVHAAINNYGDSEPCDDYAAPQGPTGPVNGQAVTVSCAVTARSTAPVNALLSLGTVPGEEGVESTTDLRVLGDIVSNSTVRAGGTMVVQGDVSAQGNCTPALSIQTAPPAPLHCANSNPQADPGGGRDPDYTPASHTVPVRRTVPACPPAAPPPRVVRLEPGYYDDDALGGLNALTAAGGCTGAVLWFKPGLYYFDFTFMRGTPAPGSGTWTIAEPSVYVVAGTPAGWDSSDGVPFPSAVPGSCQQTGPGVQIVMGGRETRLDVTAGRVEVCAEPSTTDQRIAIFGLRAPSASHLLAPTAVAGQTTFTGTAAAMTIGEQPPPPLVGPLAAVAVVSPAVPSASITLTDFKPVVPEGALIDAATLRISHQDEAGISEVTVTAAGETCPPHALVPSPATPYTVDTVDLKACGIAAPASLNSLAVTYTAATTGPAVSDRLDGVAVDVVYRAPVTRKPTAATAVSNFGTPANPFDPADTLDIGDLDPDGVPVTATATLGGATTSAAVTLAGMANPPIPLGSTIDSAVLRVAHRDQGDIATGGPTITVGACAPRQLSVFAAAIAEDRIDLKADCGLTTPAALAALTATYQVAVAPAGTATDDLDGIWLELIYSPPPATPREAGAASPGGGFTMPSAAIVLDAATADADLDDTTPSASLTVNGFTPPAPAASAPALDTAVVRVRHRDDGNAGPVSLTATWTAGGGGSCHATFPPRTGPLVDDRLDLRACGLGDPTLAGLEVTYRAVRAGSGGTATNHVDGIVLDLAYAPASVLSPATTSAVTGFVDPDRARAIGEAPPRTTDAAVGATAASITLGGFDQVGIPPGSAIDSARLRVVHQDDGPIGPVGLTAAFDGATLPCGNAALPLHAGAPGEDTVDLTSCGFDDASQLASLATTYTAAATADTTRPPTNVAAATFSNFGNALAVDSAAADAAFDTTTSATASITLDGYDVVAPGATVDSAVLRIVHRDDGPVTASVSVSWTGGAGGACVVPLAARPATLSADVVSLKDCGLMDVAHLTGLSVTYTATLTPPGTTGTDYLDGIDLLFAVDRLDGVVLDVVFRPPAFRPLSGCLTTGPFPSAGCALVRVAPAIVSTRFVSRGTIYAPTSALDIAMAGLDAQVLSRGVIARSIRLGLATVAGFSRPTSGVPPEAVVFTAYPAANVRTAGQAANVAGFGTANNAMAIDGTTADGAIDTTSPPFAPATMQFDDFSDPTIEPGTFLDAAVLRVAHEDGARIGSVTVTVAFPGNTCTGPREIPLRPVLAEDRLDLAACGLTGADQLADLNVVYSATADPSATPADSPVIDRLDGIVVVVRFGPMVRASVSFDQGQATVLGWNVLR